jgi:hypothetical protein
VTSAPPYAGSRGAALRAPLTVAGATLAATAYVGAVDPNEGGHYPACPFLALTGLYCPVCGSLRAVHALAHGDVPAAVGLNVLTVAAVTALAGLWVVWVVGVVRAGRAAGGARDRHARPSVPRWVGLVLLVAAVAFGVLRNLPVGSALAP